MSKACKQQKAKDRDCASRPDWDFLAFNDFYVNWNSQNYLLIADRTARLKTMSQVKLFKLNYELN